MTGTIAARPKAWTTRTLPRAMTRAEVRPALPASLTASMPLAVLLVGGTAAEARLAHRELWFAAVGRLAVGPRQSRTDQPPMHRPFFVRAGRNGRRVGVDRGERRGVERLRRRGHRRLVDAAVLGLGAVERWRNRRDEVPFRSLPALRRHLCVLVFVVRVARGASRLLHLVVNHRDDRVIGDAALARTVVVEDVTEPNPALLHLLVRPPHVGAGRSDVAAGQISANGLSSVVVHLLIHARTAL
jgi:hypothetical protein